MFMNCLAISINGFIIPILNRGARRCMRKSRDARARAQQRAQGTHRGPYFIGPISWFCKGLRTWLRFAQVSIAGVMQIIEHGSPFRGARACMRMQVRS